MIRHYLSLHQSLSWLPCPPINCHERDAVSGCLRLFGSCLGCAKASCIIARNNWQKSGRKLAEILLDVCERQRETQQFIWGWQGSACQLSVSFWHIEGSSRGRHGGRIKLYWNNCFVFCWEAVGVVMNKASEESEGFCLRLFI